MRAKGTLAMRMTLARVCVGCVTLAVLAGAPMTDAAQQGAAAGEWRSYGGDTGSTKYSPLAQITSENVGDLAVAWRWESADGRFDLDNLRAYYPALQIGNDTSNVSINGLKGTPLMVGDTLYLTTALSQVAAIDAATGETRWVYEQRAATMSLVATGGDLLFGGDTNGRFRAFDQETGEVLWEINLGSSVTGFPVTYAVDGRQYVAVSTGATITTAAFGMLTPELRPSTGNNLFVFALP